MPNKKPVIPNESAPTWPRLRMTQKVCDFLPHVILKDGKWVSVPDEWVMPGGGIITSKQAVEQYRDIYDLRIVNE